MTGLDLFLLSIAADLLVILIIIRALRSYIRGYLARIALPRILNEKWKREEDLYHEFHDKGIHFSPKQFRRFMNSLISNEKIEVDHSPQHSLDPENIRQRWYRTYTKPVVRSAVHSTALY